jgi:hypothetical protein
MQSGHPALVPRWFPLIFVTVHDRVLILEVQQEPELWAAHRGDLRVPGVR